MTSPLPAVRVAGTPREVGHAHGVAAREAIGDNVALYFRRFQDEWGIPREAALERARRYRRVIWDLDGDYSEALEGLAQGSGHGVLDLVALNARYEIVYSASSQKGRAKRGPGPAGGCTAAAVLPERTEEGRLLMAQNWDWIPGVRRLILQYRIDGGPAVVGFTEAGIVGPKIGLNGEGLGLLINGLVSNEDAWDRPGLPFHVRCWRILSSGGFDEAVRRAVEMPGPCSSNFLLGQAHGGRTKVIDLEVSPVGVARIEAQDGTLTHANHFLRARALGIWEPLEEGTSTFQRLERMDAWLSRSLGTDGKVSLEDLKTYLRDHAGQPRSICRHADSGLPEAERYETVASLILDPAGGTFMASSGPPCSSEYKVFAL